MERAPFFNGTRKKSGSFSSYSSVGDEKYGLLPLAHHQKPKIRVRALLGHCLYRRVIIWTVAALLILGLTVSTTGVHLQHGRVLDFVDFRQSGWGSRSKDADVVTFVVVSEGPGGSVSVGQNYRADDQDNRGEMANWLGFKQWVVPT